MSTSFDSGLDQAQPVRSFSYPAVGHAEDQADGISGLSADEAIRREHHAHELGVKAGEDRGRRECEQAVARERETLSKAVRDFESERQQYYRRVEVEVVQLAMAIARKVLHRESQVDPLLLAGIVRIALQKLDESTRVRVRVGTEHASAWRKHFSAATFTGPTPQVVEEVSMGRDLCILETELGTTELGIEPQLKEIEQGLFDLLAQKPGGRQ